MLFKSDKEAIRQIFREELAGAFKRTIKIEVSPRKPGDPPKYTTEKEVDLLEMLAEYLPYVEGAIRGCQLDSTKARNRAEETKGAVEQLITLALESREPQRIVEGRPAS